MAAFATKGLCYSTPADALTAWNNQFPVFDSANITYLVSSSVTAAGALTYSLNTRPITSNTLSSRTGTLQLTPCTKPDAPYDYANAGAIWAFFFSMTVGLWLVAKNAGAIINFVRRHG